MITVLSGLLYRFVRRNVAAQVVVHIDGKDLPYNVSQPVLEIVCAILNASDRIGKSANVTLTFNCSGDKVTADIKEHLPTKLNRLGRSA